MEDVLSIAKLSEEVQISWAWNFLLMPFCWYFWNISSKNKICRSKYIVIISDYIKYSFNSFRYVGMKQNYIV